MKLWDLKNGCGKQIILNSLNLSADLIYFSADWTAGPQLVEFYRKNFPNLIEYTNKSGIIFFLKNNNLTENELNKFLTKI